jgi:ADP-ribose pyrophosphatase
VTPEQDVGRVRSRRIYTGKVVSLDVDTVRFPDGSTADLEMVRHPGASAVVPLLDSPEAPDPRVLLVRQYRYAADGFVYEIPAGRLEAGESPESCAERELKEETGYDAGEVVPLLSFYTTPGFTDEKIHVFLATNLTPGEAALESDEFLEPEPIPLSVALGMMKSGRIVDGKTIIGLLFVARSLKLG